MKELILKFPASIYHLIATGRNLAYEKKWLKSYRSTLPVISVGNVTAGGNAKTPLCVYIVEKLQQMGRRPVVLSRGYGGSEKGPSLVTDISRADIVGDEPVLLFKRGIKIVVSRQRVAGAKFIEDQDIGDVIVLDDGFQHRKLNRDLDIVSMNSGPEVEPAKNLRMLPLGLLREPFYAAMKRADALILSERRPASNTTSVLDEIKPGIPTHVKMFRSFVRTNGIVSVSGSESLEEKSAVAFCGIANPEGFFATLESSGIGLLARHSFPDHYKFTTADIQRMRGSNPQAALVCTEKDAVRLPADSREGVYYLKIETVLESEKEFEQMLNTVLKLHPISVT